MVEDESSGLTEHDFVLLWNLLPANFEEAIALVPSLGAVP